MLYPDNFESKIKFDSLRALVAECCESDMGREELSKLSFSTDREVIEYALGECGEFMRILQEEDFPGGSFEDARPALERIRVEGLFLEVWEMVALKSSLESIYAILRFFKGRGSSFPILTAQTEMLSQFPYITGRLDGIISKSGTIKDSASPELNEIRRSIEKKRSGISRKIQSILKMAQEEGWCDKDTSVAVREGRVVIPVASGFKRKIKGIVYDESATGKTAYIEPNEIVEANNEIRELEGDERREILRILRKFADDIRPYIDELIPCYDFLAHIDFVKAKAKFSLKLGAVVPKISSSVGLTLHKAKHPLLYLSLKQVGKDVVPLDIKLDREQRIAVISGPNAGGKSVSLQTVGLLQYMFQCGMPVPAAEYSQFGIFDDILIDIGDEQSIENDLSTYSSHLVNMKNFLRYGGERSLILIDEFGTGTEPTLGGAIAEAVLRHLNEQGVYGVITTHYTVLKLLAAETDGIVNGAMLYDSAGMTPLFELRLGEPGSSFAFEIARKIGLPKEITDEAAERVGDAQVSYDKYLKEIARDRHYWEEKRKKIRESEKRLDGVLERYSRELADAEGARKRIVGEAKEEAKRILSDANRVIENTIKGIKESQAERERTKELRLEMERERERLLTDKGEDDIERKMEQLKRRKERKGRDRGDRGKSGERSGRVSSSKREGEKREANALPEAGDFVRLANGAVGEVISTNGKDAKVAMGGILTTVKISTLKRLTAEEAAKVMPKRARRSGSYELMSGDRMNFKPDIDVRGMRVEEVLPVVTRFVDDALVVGVSEVRILHGTGGGVLRDVIRQWLEAHPAVRSCRDESVNLGGAGITVVTIDL